MHTPGEQMGQWKFLAHPFLAPSLINSVLDCTLGER